MIAQTTPTYCDMAIGILCYVIPLLSNDTFHMEHFICCTEVDSFLSYTISWLASRELEILDILTNLIRKHNGCDLQVRDCVTSSVCLVCDVCISFYLAFTFVLEWVVCMPSSD